MNNRNSLEEQVKEAIERCKGGKCEGCPFNGVPSCCVTVLLHIQHAKDGHHQHRAGNMDIDREAEYAKGVGQGGLEILEEKGKAEDSES